jgi:hypothetical protein
MSNRTRPSVHSAGLSRTQLIDAASDALKNISIPNGPALITFWGNRGVGKTTLLTDIVEYFAAEGQAEIITIDDIAKSAVEKIKHDLDEKISELSLDKSVVILVDDLDELLRTDSQSFFNFERTVVQPLIAKGNVLILCTSQIELNQWREDDVRIRQVNYHLEAMGYEEVMSFLSETGIPAKKAYQLTLGHPNVASWLKADPRLSDRQLASKAWTYFLEGIPADAMSIAEIIYQFPVFNIFILQKTYEILTGVQLGYLDSLERIKEYIRRGLLYWDVSIGSYRFTDSAVRRLLARQILYGNPARFDQVQQIASEYFRSEAQSPGYLPIHFVSAIYHMAQARRNFPEEVRGQEGLDWVQSNKGRWLSTRWADVLSAWKSGAGEPAVCEEIRELIGSKQFTAITREIKDARKLLEVNK